MDTNEISSPYLKVTMTKYTIPDWSDDDCLTTFYLLQIIQRKYVGNILTVLCLKGPKGFGELQRELKPISAKVLSEQLKMLVHKKLITKKSIMEGKVNRSIYTLSHKPEEFKTILSAFKQYVVDLPNID